MVLIGGLLFLQLVLERGILFIGGPEKWVSLPIHPGKGLSFAANGLEKGLAVLLMALELGLLL